MSVTFDAYREAFAAGPLAAQMRATVEDSPWHREANVWVHTLMALEQLELELEHRGADARTRLLARLAVLFHDVGKPDAEEELARDDGSKYRRYSGHEALSAAAFAQAWLTDPLLRELLPEAADARRVRLIVEHHLPYGLKDPRKLGGLRGALEREGATEAFLCALRGDARGRISDDHVLKLERVEWWAAQFLETAPWALPDPEPGRGTVRLLVGPSGAGKTTRIRRDYRPGDVVISLDDARLLAHGESGAELSLDRVTAYADAWAWAIEHEAEVEAEVRRMESAGRQALLAGRDVHIDATCLSRKRRARWVALAEATRSAVVATELWVPEAELLRRGAARPDKRLPAGAVRSHVYAQTCVLSGAEAHEVRVEAAAA
jgi:predicted kinase